MTKQPILLLLFLFAFLKISAQTKVSGVVFDDFDEPVAFANVYFKNSTIGVITDENGRFYMESPKKESVLLVSFVGYTTQEVPLTKSVNYNLKIILQTGVALNEVTLFAGKTSKKNNPAIDILRKIWERKKSNGLKQYQQYQYDKYEKIEFDMNSIDSTFMKSKLFEGMELVFDYIDTSHVTGKTYLPIFINESFSEVYGDNTRNKEKEILKGNKNSGFNNNQSLIEFVKDLYVKYDIYDNYLNFFDKSFTSPLSRTGISVYNYVLSDSAYIDNKWCYNIVYYPRRKNELTFKGDFWVNDTTFAIKKINLQASKSANINWIKDIYVEQEFDVVNDSTLLLKRDYMMSDFSLSKKEASRGVYGKRTTIYHNHQFDIPKDPKFYKKEVNFYSNQVYNQSDEFWNQHRFEKLSNDEVGVYAMLDTLQTVKKFQRMYDAISILGSGYIQINNFDYGPILSSVGYNAVEGFRVFAGGRTFFGQNDTWRLQGYGAYGFKDNQFKYALSGKIMLEKSTRLILSGGNRRDIEQAGASLTTSNDLLGRNFASSSLFAFGTLNDKLSSVNLSNLNFEIEPVKNLVFTAGFTYRTIKSASPTFSIAYHPSIDETNITHYRVKQSELTIQLDYTPGKKTIGYGVDRSEVDNDYTRLWLNYNEGIKGVFDSDFNYRKLQLYLRKPVIIGPIGRLQNTIEIGKTFGNIPLALISVIPGNQSYFKIENNFNLLNYYEFIADTYISAHIEHNFNGKILGRIPFLRELNWREIIGVKGVYGTVTGNNKKINASTSELTYEAPTDVYWEYHAGIGNIFKVFRLDFAWRGSYLNHLPNSKNFGFRGSFGFYF
ncbi:MAG: carboxypeptidase-like regulatory domain-containing protein [Flavobacteriales bacterium]|nr:carboxypeptidase-like regulatory domain-containing protein [Flavobacteriales bacterium]